MKMSGQEGQRAPKRQRPKPIYCGHMDTLWTIMRCIENGDLQHAKHKKKSMSKKTLLLNRRLCYCHVISSGSENFHSQRYSVVNNYMVRPLKAGQD